MNSGVSELAPALADSGGPEGFTCVGPRALLDALAASGLWREFDTGMRTVEATPNPHTTDAEHHSCHFHRWVRDGCLCVLGFVACSGFADEDDVLATDPETGQSTQTSSAWDCRSSSTISDPLVYSEAASLRLTLGVIDIATRRPPPGLRVRACLITDLGCERPLTESLSVSEDGVVTVPLAVGLSGFLELTGDGVAPALFILPSPLSQQVATLLQSQPVILIPNGAEPNTATALRMPSDPAAGTLVVTAFDCAGQPAAGVRLELDTVALPFAIVDGLPIMNQTTTTSYATAGFVNVTPGVAVVRGYRADTGQLVGQDAVPVRPGWDTLVSMLPEGVAP